MESTQAFLTSTIIVIWYFASTLIIFDFLVGLPSLMQQAAVKPETTATQIVNQEQSIQKTFMEGLNDASTVPISNVDEATVQYLEMIGADLGDFDSIQEARDFLDVHAGWTVETSYAQVPEPMVPSAASKEVFAPRQVSSYQKASAGIRDGQDQEVKLSFERVEQQFAKLGWTLQKHRTGHNRYRVNVNGLHHRFKTLQDALDWLDVSRRLIKVATK